jgi:hypothetical protein
MEAFLINLSRSKELRNTGMFFDFLAIQTEAQFK